MLKHKAEVIEDLVMAEPSRLYCLSPEGLGTAYIESLTSYLSRLSAAHCLKTGILFSKVLLPYLDKHYMNQIIIKGGNGFYKHAHTINGVTDTAVSFIDLITDLTGSIRCSDLTLLRLRGILPIRGLLKSNKAWCSACFEDMKQNKMNIYEPLIWLLQPVNICLHHQIKLEEKCPDCLQKNLIISRRSRPGYCEHCSSWLGRSDEYMTELDDWEQVKTIRIAELMESNTSFEKTDICNSLRQLVSCFANSNIAQFSRQVDVPKTTLWSWYSGKNVPTLEDVLRICNKFGISLVEFYSNKLSFEMSHVINAKRKGKVNINCTIKSLYEIGRSIKIFIKSKSTQSVTVTTMAKKLACNKKTLYKHFNRHCRAQAIRSTQYRRDFYEVKVAEQQLEVESAFLNVIKQGYIPSLHNVSGSLEKPGVMRDPLVRLKLNSLIAGLKGTKYSIKHKGIV